MKNTKFRKRALLSSVAMLIVALIALGSATFAWYQANPTATATGMTMKTTAASGLEIATDSDNGSAAAMHVAQVASAAALTNWGTTANLAATSLTLQPASYNSTDDKFYTTTGESADVGTKKSDAAITDDGQYLEERVYFKIGEGSTTSANVKLTNVSFGTTATDMAGAVRIAIFDASGTFIQEYAPTGSTTQSVLTSTGTATKTTVSAGAQDQLVCSGISKTASLEKCIIVRVYLDGFDSNVTSAKAITIGGGSTNILSNLSLTFTLVGAA